MLNFLGKIELKFIGKPRDDVKVCIRKVTRFPLQIERIFAKKSAKNKLPAVLVNSFPKSGTHLLSQLFERLPHIKDYDYFVISSTPSPSFMTISVENMCSQVKNIINGELVRGHLHHSEKIATLLCNQSVITYFIYRDLRDVVLSEAYYLTYMNKWHQLHKYFWKHRNHFEEAITLAIKGLPDGGDSGLYLDIQQRFQPFLGWIFEKSVFSVKFEELISEQRDKKINDIIQYYIEHSPLNSMNEKLLNIAITSINPKKSHTFRQGKVGTWRHSFTTHHKETMKEIAGSLLIKLGYETHYDW